MESYTQIIKLWPTLEQMARDLNNSSISRIEVDANMVKAWKRRNSIPPAYWMTALDAAHANNYKLELMDFAEIAHNYYD